MRRFLLTISLASALLLSGWQPAQAGKKVTVHPLPESVAKRPLAAWAGTISDFQSIHKSLAAAAYYDSAAFYLALQALEPRLGYTLGRYGLSFQFDLRDFDFIVRMQAAPVAQQRTAPGRPGFDLHDMLPVHLRQRLLQDANPHGFVASIFYSGRHAGANLIAPEFTAAFDSSTQTLLLRLPRQAIVYPDGVLPIQARASLKIKLEIGDSFFGRRARMVSSQPAWFGFTPPPEQRPGDEGEIPFTHQKATVELVFPPSIGHAPAVSGMREMFNLPAYLATIAAWRFESRDAGFTRRPGADAMEGAVFPITLDAIVASPPLVEATMAYVATRLDLTAVDKEQALRDFASQWETENYLPVVLRLHTRFHQSYLDLARWSTFLRDGKDRLYEAEKMIELADEQVFATPDNQANADRLARRELFGNSKRVVLLFRVRSDDGVPLYGGGNPPLTLVVLSEEKPDQRRELVWQGAKP